MKRDELVIRRRNKLRRHSTIVSNVILRGYHHVSDHAKLTYLVIDSYDWPDEDGLSKGNAWPSIATLAAERGKSYVSIWRDIKELVAAGLLTVESGQRRGTTNVYWIEDPSSEEFERYLARRRGLAESKDLPTPLSESKDPPLANPQHPGFADSQDKESSTSKQHQSKQVVVSAGGGGWGWDLDTLWATLVAELKPRPTDRRWLEGARLHAVEADTLVVAAPTTFAAEWIAGRLADRLREAAARLLNRRVAIRVVSAADAAG